jgi:competence protein ComEA
MAAGRGDLTRLVGGAFDGVLRLRSRPRGAIKSAMNGIRRLFTIIASLVLAALPPAGLAQLALETFWNCRLVPTDWADGDSFLVETADGAQHTIRLYGVDCVESTATTDTDARRLREQRRYFGISEAGGSAQASIKLALEAGQEAAATTARLLEQSFTMHTAFADARGASGFKRVYGFVTTSGGDDLAEQLVSLGLARAFGVARTTPDGRSAEQYREKLRDLELRAAKLGAGIWAATDWEKLPDERQQQRDEAAELALATGKAPPSAAIDPNTASISELMAISGIGEVTAARIVEERPFASIPELTRVPGIGPKLLARISPFLEIPAAETVP